jgi:hypothetical protein
MRGDITVSRSVCCIRGSSKWNYKPNIQIYCPHIRDMSSGIPREPLYAICSAPYMCYKGMIYMGSLRVALRYTHTILNYIDQRHYASQTIDTECLNNL